LAISRFLFKNTTEDWSPKIEVKARGCRGAFRMRILKRPDNPACPVTHDEWMTPPYRLELAAPIPGIGIFVSFSAQDGIVSHSL
jgi:hypothetical protein